ncbi:hypothetical protein phiAS5_ORF0248 [Aeromonas phage phiAS5]|uniref:Uncharacterized protein n=1 Tax=Aeromonas phage phiAS5 TaxID=879630 RepID=E1A202_9CAUD|nr:hypothetical protein phiAS5_ORF0248 [Aeromonas phage phiAS5]ADM80091.1 hypothetical protein phiAS5_ORF0248 [Aeromonas phage phiAS5]BES53145.1 hypothetical protein [Aeromonas phage phiWae14]
MYDFKPVKTETKVTRIKNRYHIRLFVDGKLYDEMACQCRIDIGLCCRKMLRWVDKMGHNSPHASAVRRRMWNSEKYQQTSVGKIWYIGLRNDQ